MKFTPLLILVLVLWGGCQQAQLGCSSDLSHVLKEAYNPSLLTLQYLTEDMKIENGVWPEAQSDYLHVFGDTASVILADFEVLNFNTSGDTLIVNYTLKEPRREKEPVVEFVSFQTSKDSSTIKFDHNVHRLRTVTYSRLMRESCSSFRIINMKFQSFMSIVVE